MGDRYIYECPHCEDDIYVGGGVNEYPHGIIQCPSCKKWWRVTIELVELKEVNDANVSNGI